MTYESTTIQISTINRDLLDRLGEYMQMRHPELWTARPAYNAIVGYAVIVALAAEEER
jgi:hypothetical protein